MVWLLYVLVSAVHLFFIYNGQADYVSWTKPLLMSVLMLIIWSQTKLRTSLSRWLFVGVWMGWLGDVFLMGSGVMYFAVGLAAFLTGHLIYLFIFSKEVSLKKQTHYIMEKPYWILPFIGFWIYAIVLIAGQESMLPKPPVYVYALVILLMSIMSINRWYAVSRASWTIVLLGSLLFIVSDFSLALKIFVGNYAFSSLLIMSTYSTAQGLIVYGCLQNELIRNK